MERKLLLGLVWQLALIKLILVSSLAAQPNRPVSLDLSASEVVGGTPVIATVTLQQNAPPGGAVVEIWSNNNVASFPSSVIVEAGTRVQTFTITTIPACASRQILLSAEYNNRSSVKQRLRISPDPNSCFDITSLTLSTGNTEPGSIVTGTVTLSGTPQDSGVLISLSSSTDIFLLPDTVFIPIGSNSADFEIEVLGDCVASQSGQIIARLATTGTQLAANLMVEGGNCTDISDIALSTSSVTGGGQFEVTVSIDPPATASGFVVDLESNNSNVIFPASFLTFTEGETEKSLLLSTVEVCDDTEALILAIGRTTGTSLSSSIAIESGAASCADLQSLVLTPPSVISGSGATGTVNLTRSAPPGGIEVELDSTSELVEVPETVTVAEGSTSATFPITTLVNCSPGSAMIIAFLPATETELRSRLTVEEVSCPSLNSFDITPQIIQGGNEAIGFIGLDDLTGPAGLHLTLETNRPDLITIPATIHIPEEEDSLQFVIQTSDACGLNEFIQVTARQDFPRVSLSLQIVLTSSPCSRLDTLELAQDSILSGNTVTGTARLSEPAGSGGVFLNLQSSHPNVASLLAGVVVPPGEESVSFTITTVPVCEDTVVEIEAIDPGGSVSRSTDLSVLGVPCLDLASFELSSDSIAGGESITATLMLDEPAPEGGFIVDLESSSSNLLLPETEVHFTEGEMEKTILLGTREVCDGTSVFIDAIARSTGTTIRQTLGILAEESACADLLSLAFTPSSIPSGEGTTGRITLTRVAPEGGTFIELESISPEVSIPATVVVPMGATTADFPVNTSAICNSVSTVVFASNPLTDTTVSARLNLAAVPCPMLSSFSITPQVIRGASEATGTLVLDGPAGPGGLLIQLTTTPDIVEVPESVLVPEGESSVQFTLETSEVCEENNFVTVTARQDGPVVERSLQIFLQGPVCSRLQALELATASVPSGGIATGTIHLTQPARSGGVSITLSSSNQFAVPSTGTVLIPEGESSADFTINAASTCESMESTLTAVDAAGEETRSASIQVEGFSGTCADLASLTPSRTTIVGGGSFELTITLTTPAPAGGVNLESHTAGNLDLPASITVPGGSSSVTISGSTPGVDEEASSTIRIINPSTGTELETSILLLPEGSTPAIPSDVWGIW
ncbi:MAG: hypothetical protein JJU11_15815 [Candidatus Sumerlaeia bacterium]|nr:hypothetical protein [Candidatus Sumerlaeia bacterium]